MNEFIKLLLSELKRHLTEIYGERLKGVYLYGSFARNEQDEESDVDVLIVLDQIENYSLEIEHTSKVVSEISLKYGSTISRAFASEKQWLEEKTMFFLNVREEAVGV